jgi:hypothetical protein
MPITRRVSASISDAIEYFVYSDSVGYASDVPSSTSLMQPEVPLIATPDPFDFADEPDGVVPLRGIIVRTDFLDDDKWTAFCETVLKSEQAGMADLLNSSVLPESATDTPNDERKKDESSSEDDDEQDADGDTAMAGDAGDTSAHAGPGSDAFIFFDPSKQTSASGGHPLLLQNASNITLLRLFNDIDIVPCLPIPKGGRKRAKGSFSKLPSARLVDWHRFHEVYSGRMIWVYDPRSNTDGCARLITQRPTKYGLAT